MSNRNTKAQIGQCLAADFDKNTWSFKMEPSFVLRHGKYVIIHEEDYNDAGGQVELENLRKAFASLSNAAIAQARFVDLLVNGSLTHRDRDGLHDSHLALIDVLLKLKEEGFIENLNEKGL